MEAIATRIQGYVLTIYPDILADLSISEEYLEYLVDEVIDRALVYMNREQLVVRYEEDLISNPDLLYDDFWDEYDMYPIPPRVERVLANAVVSMAKSVLQRNTTDSNTITKVKDGMQEVTYGTELAHFYNSSSDAEVFSGSLSILKRYIIPTVVGLNADSRIF